MARLILFTFFGDTLPVNEIEPDHMAKNEQHSVVAGDATQLQEAPVIWKTLRAKTIIGLALEKYFQYTLNLTFPRHYQIIHTPTAMRHSVMIHRVMLVSFSLLIIYCVNARIILVSSVCIHTHLTHSTVS